MPVLLKAICAVVFYVSTMAFKWSIEAFHKKTNRLRASLIVGVWLVLITSIVLLVLQLPPTPDLSAPLIVLLAGCVFGFIFVELLRDKVRHWLGLNDLAGALDDISEQIETAVRKHGWHTMAFEDEGYDRLYSAQGHLGVALDFFARARRWARWQDEGELLAGLNALAIEIREIRQEQPWQQGAPHLRSLHTDWMLVTRVDFAAGKLWAIELEDKRMTEVDVGLEIEFDINRVPPSARFEGVRFMVVRSGARELVLLPTPRVCAIEQPSCYVVAM